MSIWTAAVAAAFLGLSCSAALAQQGDAPAGDAVEPEDWAMTVIELHYANADEMAAVLSDVLPPSVTVVPYYRTNSLIISGERAVIDALVGEPVEREPAERSNGEATEAETVSGELTARL